IYARLRIEIGLRSGNGTGSRSRPVALLLRLPGVRLSRFMIRSSFVSNQAWPSARELTRQRAYAWRQLRNISRVAVSSTSARVQEFSLLPQPNYFPALALLPAIPMLMLLQLRARTRRLTMSRTRLSFMWALLTILPLPP